VKGSEIGESVSCRNLPDLNLWHATVTWWWSWWPRRSPTAGCKWMWNLKSPLTFNPSLGERWALDIL